MITVGYYCDVCGIGFESEYKYNDHIPGKGKLISKMRQNGYNVGKQILCPNCKPWRKHSKDRSD